MKKSIKVTLSTLVLAAAAGALPVAAAQPAQATWAPGWNNLWVRAACTSYPLDNVTSFNVWAPNSSQGDKNFNVPTTGLGAYTGYYHYDNVYKSAWGSSYLNYRVNCEHSGARAGQLRWGGNLGSTSWVDIRA